MKITVEKIGGIWHGTIEGHPEVDERGLTEEIAKRKAERIAERMIAEKSDEDPRRDERV
jgi:hypothetical protein